ncbi:MAG: Xaa-Pro aminopeptidase [Gammaproteobacteria bacterium]
MNLDEFQKRREQILQKMEPNSIAIISAAPEIIRNGDNHYRYRQNSDFYYLTGFCEPEAVAVLISDNNRNEFILFNRPRNAEQEIWVGERAGVEGACSVFGASQAFSIAEMNETMPKLLANRNIIYWSIGYDKIFDQQITEWLNQLRTQSRKGVQVPEQFYALDDLLHEMRLIKSDHEIICMRKAADVSVNAHKKAMQHCKPGLMEYEIEAVLRYEFIRQGCISQAYPAIVAGGKNACTLHYIDNDQALQSGDLLLIDAGAEYEYYASDITRTFPINGRFTAEQKAIYEIVLAAQLAGIAEVYPGNAWPNIQKKIIQIITEGLVELGILKGSVSDLIELQAYKEFYMHNSGHWLGLDVHDVGAYRTHDNWRTLAPGMVLTVEPGIYIRNTSDKIDPCWHNIGIRIEDDVLVTEESHEVFTQGLIKDVIEIEYLVGHKG